MLRSEDETKRYVRMLEVFPRRAKCTFFKFGSSGGIAKEDVLCILPQNIVSEKIYLVMWVWFIILTVITSLQVRQ